MFKKSSRAPISWKMRVFKLAVLASVFGSAMAQGIYRNGIGARSVALAGADVAYAEGPLAAMALNPAGMSTLSGPSADASLLGGILNGEFTNAANPGGAKLDDGLRVGGEGAFAMPLGPVVIGLSIIPEAPLSADWTYNDTDPDGPGGSLVSYGNQRHKSEILVLRSALGLSWKISDQFSVGASLGLIYNDNTLIGPYIFQTQPALAGLKTLLNLNTSGFGFDGNFGAIWRPTETLQVGVAYKTPSTVESSGDADGDATVQAQEAFDPAPPFPAGTGAFHYDAEVINHFPQVLSAGLSWKALPKLRLAGQVDWMNWSDAFDNLQVNLRNGSNGTINGLVGSPNMKDEAPLNWEDQWVLRAGAEYDLSESWQLRGGYSWANSPVPDAFLLPLVAAIAEHTFGVGAGWKHGRFSIDAAYQYSIPAEQNVTASGLRSGEYSNSRVEVSAHAFAITGGVRF